MPKVTKEWGKAHWLRGRHVKEYKELYPAIVNEYAHLVRVERGDTIVPSLITQESAALIVLAVTLVVYRTFRERTCWFGSWLADAFGCELEPECERRFVVWVPGSAGAIRVRSDRGAVFHGYSAVHA